MPDQSVPPPTLSRQAGRENDRSPPGQSPHRAKPARELPGWSDRESVVRTYAAYWRQEYLPQRNAGNADGHVSTVTGSPSARSFAQRRQSQAAREMNNVKLEPGSVCTGAANKRMASSSALIRT